MNKVIMGKRNIIDYRTAGLLIFLSLFIFNSCKKDFTPEELEYIKSIEQERVETNDWMKNSPNSPFNFKGKVEFHPLNYFDVDPSFVFESKLYEYEEKDTVVIYGTKGEARYPVKFGYVKINYEGKDHKVTVYETTAKSGEKYYSIWFTDRTTNEESYGVGRYLNFTKIDDPENIYTIDFNLTYNPYCAYSKDFTCPIPSKDDYIDLAISAGEKKFHD
jgi:uncharacterized protein (DUF1684 family)